MIRSIARKRTTRLTLLIAAAALGCPAVLAQEPLGPPIKVAPEDSQPVTAGEDLEKAVQRGAEILLERQESLDGNKVKDEWPYEGVYRVRRQIPPGYRVGGTAICMWAICSAPGYKKSKQRRAAVERGARFILDTLEEPLMASGFKDGYDVRGWGHTYALDTFLRMRAADLLPKKLTKAIDKKIAWLVATLCETAIPEVGGWNYARRGGGEKPTAASHFMTAPTLLALYEADEQGENVDAGVVEQALSTLEASRMDKGFFGYTTRSDFGDLPGSIGRWPATEVCLKLGGRGDEKLLVRSLDAFLEHWDELEKRRRKNGTHKGDYGIAPYYFFYAQYYAAVAIEHLPESMRSEYREHFLERLFSVREESGGWNDRVFDRSENFGTAMAMLAIMAPDASAASAWSGAAKKGSKAKKKR